MRLLGKVVIVVLILSMAAAIGRYFWKAGGEVVKAQKGWAGGTRIPCPPGDPRDTEPLGCAEGLETRIARHR